MAFPVPASTAAPAWLPGCPCWWGQPTLTKILFFHAFFHGLHLPAGRGTSYHPCPQSCCPPTSVTVSSAPLLWVGAVRRIRAHRAGGRILRVLSTHGSRSVLTGVCRFGGDLG